MIKIRDFKENISSLFSSDTDFDRDQLVLDIFSFQFSNNEIYQSFCKLLQKTPDTVQCVEDIPFLPISFFKSHRVVCGSRPIEKIFESSGTTGSISSKHHVADINWYNHISTLCFESHYGPLEDHTFIGLLPGYLERNNSSLVHMVNHFMQQTPDPISDFYLKDFTRLISVLRSRSEVEKKIVLIGVSFALLDLAERFSNEDFQDIIVMETGGMKGTRSEIIRSDLHLSLMSSFGVNTIHSEYGMTELLSQAYSKGNGLFYPSPSMQVLPGRITDPFAWEEFGSQAMLRIIDLANIDSCCFIATDDIGRVFSDGSFEVLGRFDQSDLRGCNLMYL